MLPMKRVEKVLAGFEDNADVVSGCLKDFPRPTQASLESSREHTDALSEKPDKTF